MRVAALGFFFHCAHEQLPVTLEVKESAVCYRGRCLEISASNPSKRFTVVKVCIGRNYFCLDRAVFECELLSCGLAVRVADSQRPGLENFGKNLVSGSHFGTRILNPGSFPTPPRTFRINSILPWPDLPFHSLTRQNRLGIGVLVCKLP